MSDLDSQGLLGGLVGKMEEAKKVRRPFREQSARVGAVYSMTYDRAVVAVFDYHREKAGGLPKGGFLIAAKKEGDEGFILLRILKDARLPNAADTDTRRQQGIEDSSNETPWADALHVWQRREVSLHALECRILGTFMVNKDGEHQYAEDTDNYYSVNELMVWKPDEQTLHLIVNHRHHRKILTVKGDTRKRIGQTRFSAAERGIATRTQVLLDPTDMLSRRTVYLGMSRSGKSNAMKITAERIYRLREENEKCRIGQLIFDPNGEYAQDNPQDGPGLHRVHEVLGLERKDEVETYGLFVPQTDKDRRVMKFNFYGDELPGQWRTDNVNVALEQMLTGREIIRDIMEDAPSQYMKAFRDVDLSVPNLSEEDRSQQVRYRRAVLVHQTALAAAGFKHPHWNPSVRGLFRKEIVEALERDATEAAHEYQLAARHLTMARESGKITWDQLVDVFRILNQFLDSPGGKKFESEYMKSSTSGEHWADPKLRNLLRIFESQNGPRYFQRAQEQHAPTAVMDFAERVVNDLREGKLVIVDQSTGDPEQNKKAAERIMWKVFKAQQDDFRRGTASKGDEEFERHILVYIEEAHNLLPKARAQSSENLRTVWARSAKEGSKMNLGMILATQAPSSIMPEILSETDNWILAYLNSENERRVISGYMDFGDFIEQIGQVSEPGFVRLRTLSLAYTVPVQVDQFRLVLPDEQS